MGFSLNADDQSIRSSRPSTQIDGKHLRGRDFNASCIAYAMKSPVCHLSPRQRYIHGTPSPMSSRIWLTPLARQFTRALTTTSCLVGRAWKAIVN
ncbi:hypothetical protein TNCV_1816551 [Trichonephila clavipes]|nr:hypothetical protein TNCV_1816551 [Trichonephila clavipes]